MTVISPPSSSQNNARLHFNGLTSTTTFNYIVSASSESQYHRAFLWNSTTAVDRFQRRKFSALCICLQWFKTTFHPLLSQQPSPDWTMSVSSYSCHLRLNTRSRTALTKLILASFDGYIYALARYPELAVMAPSCLSPINILHCISHRMPYPVDAVLSRWPLFPPWFTS